MDEDPVDRADQHVDDGSRSAREEIERIVRSATIWTASGVLTSAIGIGPLLAAGWRRTGLSGGGSVCWSQALGSLSWSAPDVGLGAGLRSAYRQTMRSVGFGIVLNIAGIAIAVLAAVPSPVIR